MVWTEFQLIYGQKFDSQKLYDLRKSVIPILDEFKISDFLILNEPTCVYLRVEIDEKPREEMKEKLMVIVKASEESFSDVKISEWDPQKDAKDRILGVAKKLGIDLEEGKGWMVAYREPLNQHWILTEDDLNLKIDEFSKFMTSVVGKFTRAYFENMPRRIQDRWLFSVLLHLLLNSISFDQIQEKETRAFPFI